jgi:hypothetical protein
MADAPLCMVFCGCFDRFMIAYGVFPVNPTKFHNKTRAKCTKTGSVFLWSTSVLARAVWRLKEEKEPIQTARIPYAERILATSRAVLLDEKSARSKGSRCQRRLAAKYAKQMFAIWKKV